MEHISEPVASHTTFIGRLSFNFLIACLVVGVSLAAGMFGYHVLVGLTWMDAFLNASMILSGMGPLAPMPTDDGKLFAGLYALYSGLVLVLSSGLILAPIAHRLLHRLHVECE